MMMAMDIATIIIGRLMLIVWSTLGCLNVINIINESERNKCNWSILELCNFYRNSHTHNVWSTQGHLNVINELETNKCAKAYKVALSTRLCRTWCSWWGAKILWSNEARRYCQMTSLIFGTFIDDLQLSRWHRLYTIRILARPL